MQTTQKNTRNNNKKSQYAFKIQWNDANTERKRMKLVKRTKKKKEKKTKRKFASLLLLLLAETCKKAISARESDNTNMKGNCKQFFMIEEKIHNVSKHTLSVLFRRSWMLRCLFIGSSCFLSVHVSKFQKIDFGLPEPRDASLLAFDALIKPLVNFDYGYYRLMQNIYPIISTCQVHWVPFTIYRLILSPKPKFESAI